MTPAESRALGWTDGSSLLAETDLDGQIATLVSAHSALLYRVCFSVLRNAGDAEDAVQETFLRVLRHRSKLAEVRDTRVWLIRIAFNLALDAKRRRRHISLDDDASELAAATLPSKEISAEQQIISAQRHSAVLRLMDSLPQKERAVLLLSALDELDISSIAGVLETTESTIRSRLFRARQQLRQRMDRAGGGGR